MSITPQQLQQLKLTFPQQDENTLLLAATYLEKNLSKKEFDTSLVQYLQETFSPQPSISTVVNELKCILNVFSSTIVPTVSNLAFRTINTSDAVTLCARLIAGSAVAFVTSEDEIPLPDNPKLPALSQLFPHLLDEHNNTPPDQISYTLARLFETFPDTEKITALTDLSLQARLAEEPEEEQGVLSYAKELITPKKINISYLKNALDAFTQWLKRRKAYPGALYKITEQADRLATKYPATTESIVKFCYKMFFENLNDKKLVPRYFAIFSRIIDAFILLDDEKIVTSLCTHIDKGSLDKWKLIWLFDHPLFKTFSPSERRIILNLISTLLDNHLPIEKTHLASLLKKCEIHSVRIALLQRLNEFYRQPAFPSLAAFIDWINLVPDNNAQSLALFLEIHYVMFNKPDIPKPPEPWEAVFKRQHEAFQRDLAAYANTSCLHTRKARAALLSEFSTKQLTDFDKKSSAEKKTLLRETLTEWYLHYATIENANGILSRALEKRLIHLLQIPDDAQLQAAYAERNSFSYKICTFFCAGRAFFKSYRDKAKDPVHAIIWQHLDPNIKSQIKPLRNRILQLDAQDRFETTLAHP